MKHKLFKAIPILSLFVLSSCSLFKTEQILMVNKKPTQLSFNTGQAFNIDGMEVIDSISGKTVTNFVTSIEPGYIFQSSDAELKKSVEVSKSGFKSTSYLIDVYDLPALEISSLPKTKYRVGDTFSLEGLIVTCGNEVIEDYTSSITDGTTLTKGGYHQVVISKTGYFPTNFRISVDGALSLKIKRLPTNIIYNQGDSFSTSGLEVVDQDNQPVTDYTLSINNGNKLKYASDEIPITVSKELYQSAKFNITVNPVTNTDIVDIRNLTIYYVNDTHGSFIRQEKANSYQNEAGMAYIGKYFKTQKANDPNNTLILSGGDMFQGGYESNVTYGKVMIDAMNNIGFDAMVLGNHEFDWGEEVLQDMVGRLNCPTISCNSFYSTGESLDYIAPYTIIEKDNLKIGIIGGAIEGMGSSIDSEISTNFSFPSPNSYIKKYSTELRLSYNCDLIIAGFHDGGFEGYDGEPTKYSDLVATDPLTNSKYVDAMFFAHDHLGKNGTYQGVPYLEAWSNGRDYGVMTLNVASNGINYTVRNSFTNVVQAYNACKTEDAEIAAIPSHYAEEIGNPDEVIYTFKNDYTSDAFATVACKAMLWYVNNNQETFDNHYVYASCHNLGGVRSAVQRGDFTYRNLIEVFPFDNKLIITKCNQSNINRMFSHLSLRAYSNQEIVYTNGYTKAVIITYIRKYSGIKTSELASYPNTAKEALVSYLQNSGDDSL